MIPVRISIENFLSFGPETVFTFDENEPLWVLSGPNGVGKSTVFDAITYALFGCHRGGKQEHTELIRHGANGFRIEFEFDFDGERYRVTRSRNKKGRSVQTAERWNEQHREWDTLNIEDKASGLTDWVEAAIGLDYIAFTSSVLLKQGEADAFIRAKPGPKLELLKKIVQLQPFEQLSARVHEATSNRKAKCSTLQSQFSNIAVVTDDELATAEQQMRDAGEAKETASASYLAAVSLVEQGKRYRQTASRSQLLTQQLQAAEERAKRAEAIRTDYLRWNDLTRVVPVLVKLEPLPDKIRKQQDLLSSSEMNETAAREQYETTERSAEESEKQRNGLELAKSDAAQRVKDLEQYQKETAAQLKQTQELTEAEEKLAGFPTKLEQDLAAVADQANALGQTIAEADRQAFALKAQLQQHRRQLDDFSLVETGVPCSRCGQKVTKEHAANEKARLDELITQNEQQLKELGKDLTQHQTACDTLKKQIHALQAQQRNQSAAKNTVEALQRSLHNQNITATQAELLHQQHDIERKLPQVNKQSTEAKKAFDDHITACNRLTAELKSKRSAKELAQLQTVTVRNELDKLNLQHSTILGSLPEPWKAQLPIGHTLLEGFQQELKALSAKNISAEYDQLARDAGEVNARREELDRQQAQLREIPHEAQLPEAELEQRVQTYKTRQTVTDEQYQAAVRKRDDLLRRQADYVRHAASLKQAEDTLRVHQRLDKLLGKDGLQRQLVRSAEHDLADSASHTLSKLTNGELSLDLNPEAKPDEAFDLIVRQNNSSHITSVNYLSGSQKFRVSVAIALAIGKYASGRNRPLESVIIDEGFGSLDRDGLAAMARELQSLQHTAALKRIILVSHQEDFVENFPVGYRLIPGANGTTAERRSR